MNEPELKAHAYVLAVRDLEGSSTYFEAVLGFPIEWKDEGHWVALKRGEVRVNLGRCPDALPPHALGDHSYFGFFSTDAVDELHKEFAAKGAIIISGPADKPWGWREMGVATPEGHRMTFAQSL